MGNCYAATKPKKEKAIVVQRHHEQKVIKLYQLEDNQLYKRRQLANSMNISNVTTHTNTYTTIHIPDDIHQRQHQQHQHHQDRHLQFHLQGQIQFLSERLESNEFVNCDEYNDNLNVSYLLSTHMASYADPGFHSPSYER